MVIHRNGVYGLTGGRGYMSDPHVIVFVRHPEKGKVKSRIATVTGEDTAYHVYRTLYDSTMDLAGAIPFRTTIYSTGEMCDDGYRKQVGRDLGERMYNASREIFNEGGGPVVIIGSDCPDLNPELIDQAFSMLRQADLVFGPSEDGGYYLIGMNALHPSLFMDIEWGTDRVFRRSVENAETAGLSYKSLKVLYDVDTVEDARRAGLIS